MADINVSLTQEEVNVAFPGTQGPQGIQGLKGDPGNPITNGTVDPTTEGEDGDFYLNTATSFLFGPKAGGVWPAGISLIGPTGPQGAQGLKGDK